MADGVCNLVFQEGRDTPDVSEEHCFEKSLQGITDSITLAETILSS